MFTSDRLMLCLVYVTVSDDGIAVVVLMSHSLVERSGSGVELRTLDYENTGSNPAAVVKPWASFVHSKLLQFTQLNK